MPAGLRMGSVQAGGEGKDILEEQEEAGRGELEVR